MNSQEEAITQIVEKVSGISREQIRSRNRKRELALPRAVLGVILRQDAACTYKRTGQLLGRDHASVLKYIKDHDANFRYYPQYKELYRKVQKEYLMVFKGVKFSILQCQIKDLQEQLEVLIKQTEESIN